MMYNDSKYEIGDIMSFRIVADSSSNIFELEGADYSYVSLKINCGAEEFTDNAELDTGAMNEFLKKTKNRTGSACPGIGEWLDAFSGAEEIFAVTITSNLSGCYQSAVNAAEEYMRNNEGARVCVLDSLSTGPEMELIIEKLYECKSAGKSFEETEKEVREYMRKTHLLFSLKSLNNLAKNGRVSVAKAKIAGVLGIHVVGKASDVGTLEQLSNCRGEQKGLKAVLQYMIENGYDGGKVRIAHNFNLPAAEKLKEMISSLFSNAAVIIRKTGGLCSFYAEDGGLLVGYEA